MLWTHSIGIEVATGAAASSGNVSLLVHVEAMWTWWQANNGNLNQHWLTAFVLCECHIAVDVYARYKGNGTQWFVL